MALLSVEQGQVVLVDTRYVLLQPAQHQKNDAGSMAESDSCQARPTQVAISKVFGGCILDCTAYQNQLWHRLPTSRAGAESDGHYRRSIPCPLIPAYSIKPLPPSSSHFPFCLA